MRGETTPLEGVVESFFAARHDLSPRTEGNYRYILGYPGSGARSRYSKSFGAWAQRVNGRPPVVGDVEPGTVNAYVRYVMDGVSPHMADTAWRALRSLGEYLSESRIFHDNGESALRRVKRPRVKDEPRRALSDQEMWNVLLQPYDWEEGQRDKAIVWTFFGTGLRRQELVSLRLEDIDVFGQVLYVRATTSKSVKPRDVAFARELKPILDGYIQDHRKGPSTPDAPLFTDRRGGPLSGNAVRLIFDRLKDRTGIRDLSAHRCRHTWATLYNRAGAGSRLDLKYEGGWSTDRMVERYTKQRPLEERRAAPSVFSASRHAVAERRSAERRFSQQREAQTRRRVA